jgi:hypothetical protein
VPNVDGEGPELLDWKTSETRPHVLPDFPGPREALPELRPRSDALARQLEGGMNEPRAMQRQGRADEVRLRCERESLDGLDPIRWTG